MADIVLRDWKYSDADHLLKLSKDDLLKKSGIHFGSSYEDCQNFVSSKIHDSGCKVIALGDSEDFLGFISLGDMNRYNGYMELEFAISPEYRNKGYATKAVKCMLDYGFKVLEASVIAAWVRSHNQESAKVLEKCFFTYEGRLRKHARDGSDTLCYSIQKEEWTSRFNKAYNECG